jgi:proteasome lid subunit RPN8/RPN11
MKEEVIFPRPLVNQILNQAQKSPDVEVCGLVGARESQPSSYYPVDNIAESPSKRFLMKPEEQIEAMRKMRGKGEELFAICHSHPSAPARPSAIDRDQANYPDTLHIIISLNTKGVLEMRGFRIDDHHDVEEVALGIRND